MIVAPNEIDSSLQTADFDYELPAHLIAQTPLARRDASRLLILDRFTGAITHSHFTRLADWLRPGDLLVANNSRVIPARLLGRRIPSGGHVELLLLRREVDAWVALARPAKRLRPRTALEIPSQSSGRPPAQAIVRENRGSGEVVVAFSDVDDKDLAAYGVIPLPPYIWASLTDVERYQTVYGCLPGSAAAPTAGLHFTDELIATLTGAGISWTEVTLHVGLDTFRPVEVERVLDHPIHSEWCDVPESTASAIAQCRRRGGRVVAVGTTAARTLETLGRDWVDGEPRGYTGYTDEFILPGHRWKLVDALVTNFHLPRSTLLMMVSALAGQKAIFAAYREAVAYGYRFYSFGDAMLIH